jgi:pSer/pThr/pTyr-binding forkhead associated (FHA) protein
MGKKCPWEGCGYEDNRPDWEWCYRCGRSLDAGPEEARIPGGAEITGPPPPVIRIEQPVAQQPPEAPDPAKAETPAVTPGTSTPRKPAKLQLIDQGQVVREIPLRKDSVQIGRMDFDLNIFPDIDLSDYDPYCYVSRKHARIFWQDTKYCIEDEPKSVSKPRINRKVMDSGSTVELKDGDEIILGKVFLVFKLGS